MKVMETDEEEIIKKINNVGMMINIGARCYFPPDAPGDISITKNRIVFLSQYYSERSRKIYGITVHKKELGRGEIYVEIPICKITEYLKKPKKNIKKPGVYAQESKYMDGSVVFYIPLTGDFLDPGYYYEKKTKGTYYWLLEGKYRINNFIKKSKFEPMLPVSITNLRKGKTEIKDLIQNLRENSIQTDLPIVLKIGYVT